MDAEIFSDDGAASAVLKHVTAAKVLEFGICWSAHLERPLLVGLLCRCKAAAREQEDLGWRGTTQGAPLFPRSACRLPQGRPAEQKNDRRSLPHPCFRLSLGANRFALLGTNDMDEPEARRCQRCTRPMGTCDAGGADGRSAAPDVDLLLVDLCAAAGRLMYSLLTARQPHDAYSD
jgi:hypothetical protein